MYCPECGAEMQDDGVDYYFCPSCGYERTFSNFLLYHFKASGTLKIPRNDDKPRISPTSGTFETVFS